MVLFPDSETTTGGVVYFGNSARANLALLATLLRGTLTLRSISAPPDVESRQKQLRAQVRCCSSQACFKYPNVHTFTANTHCLCHSALRAP